MGTTLGEAGFYHKFLAGGKGEAAVPAAGDPNPAGARSQQSVQGEGGEMYQQQIYIS